MPNIRATIRGTVFGQEMNIVRYWRVGDLVDPDYQQFADDWGAILEGTWDVVAHTGCFLNDIYFSEAEVGSLGFALTPANFPLQGDTTSTTALPNHDGVLCIYTGGALTYPRQNRNRLAGGNEGQMESGVLTSTAQTAWQAVAEALSTSFTSNGALWTGILWSDRYQTYNVVSTASVRAQLSTQRSRRVGAGA